MIYYNLKTMLVEKQKPKGSKIDIIFFLGNSKKKSWIN